MPHSTCAIHLDMVDGRLDASDLIRLEDVFRAAEEVIEECLVPRLAERWEGSEGVSPFLGYFPPSLIVTGVVEHSIAHFACSIFC